MKIIKAQHKLILWLGFYIKSETQRLPNGNPFLDPYPYQEVGDLIDAGSAKRKINAAQIDGRFDDKTELEFTPAEIAILQKNFKRQLADGFGADDSEDVISLKEIFDGKVKKEVKPVAEKK